MSGPPPTLDRRRIRAGLGPATLSSTCIIAAVLLANITYILGIRGQDPMLNFSGLASPAGGWLAGGSTIDGNYGWTSQALGHLAATTWLDGQVPLWNVYEGLGQPLAGEMQSAAFFLPFVLLQALPQGIYLMHLSLQLVGGLSTLLFLRTLRLSWFAATAGACLFALNGAFAVMANAPFNPIAFLPLAMAGVELTARAVREGRRPRLGLWVTALAVAFMLFAGFPETAFLQGLFVAGWAVVRTISLPGKRWPFARWALAGAIVGVGLAAPVIVAFVHFLGFGDTGYHSGAANEFTYPRSKATSLALPYAIGPAGNAISHGQAGYVTLVAVVAAVVGLLGPRPRSVQVFLGLTVVLLVMNMFGIPPVHQLFNVIPGIRNILVAKYGLILIEFAVLLCAAFGLDDLRRGVVPRWAVMVACALVTIYAAGTIGYVVWRGLLTNPAWTAAAMTWTALGCAAVAAAMLLVRKHPGRARALTMAAAGVVMLNAVAVFALPQLSARAPAAVDVAPVKFLQENLGTSRFFTLGPIEANYGSYWRIAQLNANDLPVPTKYALFVQYNLRPSNFGKLSPAARGQYVPYRLIYSNSSVEMQQILFAGYLERQAEFRRTAVKYLVTRPGVVTSSEGAEHGLRLAFHNATADIWLDTGAAPYYSTAGGKCTIDDQSMTSVALTCVGPTTLVRRQLSSPGWTATVNGRSQSVTDTPTRLFQQITVPAGHSRIDFSYQPAYFLIAVVVSMALLLWLLIEVATGLRRRLRRPTSN